MIKKLRKILPIVILISIGLGVIQAKNHNMVLGVYPVDSYIGETISWEIEEISSGNNEWWNWTGFSFLENWYANDGDLLNFTVSDSKLIYDKPYLEGLFKIGNLSITTNNYDIGSNLAISCSPWVGGLIALEHDWAALRYQSPFNGTIASVQSDLVVLIIGGLTVAASRILYNDEFQTSEFFYEQETGILIYAKTNVGYFSLELGLNETSIILPTTSMTGGIVGYGFFTTIVIGCISLIVIKKKRN
jgi:hypothetical protein